MTWKQDILEVASTVVTWWIVAFLHRVYTLEDSTQDKNHLLQHRSMLYII